MAKNLRRRVGKIVAEHKMDDWPILKRLDDEPEDTEFVIDYDNPDLEEIVEEAIARERELYGDDDDDGPPAAPAKKDKE